MRATSGGARTVGELLLERRPPRRFGAAASVRGGPGRPVSAASPAAVGLAALPARLEPAEQAEQQQCDAHDHPGRHQHPTHPERDRELLTHGVR